MPDKDPPPSNDPPAEPTPDPDATPFQKPTYETVEKGIGGPWEQRIDEDD